MLTALAWKAVSKLTHWAWLGQPALVEPSPVNILYVQLPPPVDGALADGAGGAEYAGELAAGAEGAADGAADGAPEGTGAALAEAGGELCAGGEL